MTPAWVEMLQVPASALVNLYDDLDGLELKEQGPRLLALPVERSAIDSITVLHAAFEHVSFLATTATQHEVVHHLRMLREAEMPDKSTALFRYQDTRVLAGLAKLLSASERSDLLGPTMCWCCRDVCGVMHRIDNAKPTPGRPMRLSRTLAQAIDDELAPHELLAQTREADSAALSTLSDCERLLTARRHLKQATALGLTSPQDRSLYGVLAFQLPSSFADKPPFAAAIRFAREGHGSFSQGLDRADPREWEAWNNWLAEGVGK